MVQERLYAGKMTQAMDAKWL